VTIAAGFICENGFLLCADTKITTTIKTNESKMVHHVSDDGLCSLTFVMSSDDINFPRATIQACWEFVGRMEFQSATMEAVRNAVQFSLAEFYREHIFPHPNFEPQSVFQQLLVGIWLRGETALFQPHETLLMPVEEYECIGSGAHLGKYLIRQFEKASSLPATLDEIALIASCVIEEAISYDEFCGGEVETIIVRNNGQVSSICDSVIYPGREFLTSLQIGGWRLLRRISESAITDDAIEEALEDYCDSVRKTNAVRKVQLDMIREARNHQ